MEWVRWVLAAAVVGGFLVVAVGAWKGRVHLGACCPPPERDLRLRAAYDADPADR